MGKKSRRKKQKFNKRDHFVEQKSSSKGTMYVGIAISVIALIAIAAYMTSKPSGGTSASSGNSNRQKISQPVTYDANVEMTEVKSKVEGGKIAIDLNEVKKNQFVTYSYDKNQVDIGFGKQALPILAYIAPSGELVTAVSMCEPCKSIKFHIEPDGTLTCNACGTKFSIDTLEGVSGACTSYPPDEVKYVLKAGKILIDESAVADWKPRV